MSNSSYIPGLGGQPMMGHPMMGHPQMPTQTVQEVPMLSTPTVGGSFQSIFVGGHYLNASWGKCPCSMKTLIIIAAAIIGLAALAIGITALMHAMLPLAISMVVVGGVILVIDLALVARECKRNRMQRNISNGYAPISTE